MKGRGRMRGEDEEARRRSMGWPNGLFDSMTDRQSKRRWRQKRRERGQASSLVLVDGGQPTW